MNRTALLVVAHGSRRAEANADLAHLAELLREREAAPIVEIGYLELARPDIPGGAQRCVERGADEVLIVPFFLSPGSHVRDDLQRYSREFAERWPEVRFTVCGPLGVHPLLVDVVLERIREARAGD